MDRDGRMTQQLGTPAYEGTWSEIPAPTGGYVRAADNLN